VWSWWAIISLPSVRWALLYVVAMISLGRLCKRRGVRLDLQAPLVVFNIFIAVANLVCVFIFTAGLVHASSPFSMETNTFLWWGSTLCYALKVLELCDTVFIILRGNLRQLSFLHLYHHSSVLVLAEAGRITHAAAVVIGPAMNCAVHVVMYSYWALRAARFENALHWKRQVTELQLAQFVVGLVLTGTGVAKGIYCIYSVLYDISMLVLFSRFYYNHYIRIRPGRPQKKES